MGREKINLFDVLDKYEYWKRKCVKSVLGVFSSGVSVCRNKGAQSDLGTPFHQGLGGTGALPSGLYTRNTAIKCVQTRKYLVLHCQ